MLHESEVRRPRTHCQVWNPLPPVSTASKSSETECQLVIIASKRKAPTVFLCLCEIFVIRIFKEFWKCEKHKSQSCLRTTWRRHLLPAISWVWSYHGKCREEPLSFVVLSLGRSDPLPNICEWPFTYEFVRRCCQDTDILTGQRRRGEFGVQVQHSE